MQTRRKQETLALVVAFDSTASALAFAQHAKAEQFTGRLIPIPRTLSAGCGMAWRNTLDQREQIDQLIARIHIDDARVVEMMLRA